MSEDYIYDVPHRPSQRHSNQLATELQYINDHMPIRNGQVVNNITLMQLHRRYQALLRAQQNNQAYPSNQLSYVPNNQTKTTEHFYHNYTSNNQTFQETTTYTRTTTSGPSLYPFDDIILD